MAGGVTGRRFSAASRRVMKVTEAMMITPPATTQRSIGSPKAN